MDVTVLAEDDDGGHTIVTVTGDLTPTTVSQLQENLVRLIVANSFRLVVDLSAVGVVDSAAVVPVLTDAADRVQPYRGWVHLVDPDVRIELGSAPPGAPGAPLSTYETRADALRG